MSSVCGAWVAPGWLLEPTHADCPRARRRCPAYCRPTPLSRRRCRRPTARRLTRRRSFAAHSRCKKTFFYPSLLPSLHNLIAHTPFTHFATPRSWLERTPSLPTPIPHPHRPPALPTHIAHPPFTPFAHLEAASHAGEAGLALVRRCSGVVTNRSLCAAQVTLATQSMQAWYCATLAGAEGNFCQRQSLLMQLKSLPADKARIVA